LQFGEVRHRKPATVNHHHRGGREHGDRLGRLSKNGTMATFDMPGIGLVTPTSTIAQPEPGRVISKDRIREKRDTTIDLERRGPEILALSFLSAESR
jgi:hypothetical protein